MFLFNKSKVEFIGTSFSHCVYDAVYKIDLNLMFKYKGFAEFITRLEKGYWVGYDREKCELKLFSFPSPYHEGWVVSEANKVFKKLIDEINRWIHKNMVDDNLLPEPNYQSKGSSSLGLYNSLKNLLNLYSKVKYVRG